MRHAHASYQVLMIKCLILNSTLKLTNKKAKCDDETAKKLQANCNDKGWLWNNEKYINVCFYCCSVWNNSIFFLGARVPMWRRSFWHWRTRWHLNFNRRFSRSQVKWASRFVELLIKIDSIWNIVRSVIHDEWLENRTRCIDEWCRCTRVQLRSWCRSEEVAVGRRRVADRARRQPRRDPSRNRIAFGGCIDRAVVCAHRRHSFVDPLKQKENKNKNHI